MWRFESSPGNPAAARPDVIATNLTRHMHPVLGAGWRLLNPLFLKSIPQGAATQTFAAVHPDAAKLSGEYLSDCNRKRPTPHAENIDLAARLWEKTDEIVKALP